MMPTKKDEEPSAASKADQVEVAPVADKDGHDAAHDSPDDDDAGGEDPTAAVAAARAKEDGGKNGAGGASSSSSSAPPPPPAQIAKMKLPGPSSHLRKERRQSSSRFNVSSNRLQWFDYAFVPMSLEQLDLHDNNIEEMGNYYKLRSGFSLKTLDASNNKIKSLGRLSLPASLETVILSRNSISSIEANIFEDKANLVRVDLSENRLEHLKLESLFIGKVSQNGNEQSYFEFSFSSFFSLERSLAPSLPSLMC